MAGQEDPQRLRSFIIHFSPRAALLGSPIFFPKANAIVTDNSIRGEFRYGHKKDPEIPADIINAKIGGLGIYITKKFMDDISYKRKRGKNKLTMKKFTRTTRYLYQNGKTIQEPLNCLTRYH